MASNFKLIFLQTIFLILVSFLLIQDTSAQVGGIPACTNFTCRYGECEQLNNQFICHCPDGIKGENCDRKMQPGDDLCLSNPCWGGGTCQNLGNDFRCSCPSGRSGKNCRTIDSAPCIYQNPCRNNAICRVTNDNTYYCFCVGFWTGQYCDVAVSLCDRPIPCFNGGSCVNNICRCPDNFVGYQCETFTPPNTDKRITILNKGFYVADLSLNYEIQVGVTKFRTQQKASISLNQAKTFYLPASVGYDSEAGVYLVAEAIGGKRIMAVRIRSNPDCFHVWGTTLIPFWTRIDCY